MKQKFRQAVLAPSPIDLSGRVSLSLREVAQVHGVSERTAWKWHRQGVLRGQKIGQVLRFEVEHVRSLFQPANDEQRRLAPFSAQEARQS